MARHWGESLDCACQPMNLARPITPLAVALDFGLAAAAFISALPAEDKSDDRGKAIQTVTSYA
jgi:hypothetical protein